MTLATDENKKNTFVIVNAARQARGETEEEREREREESHEPDFFETLNCFA